MFNRFFYFQLHRLLGSRVRDYYQEFLRIERASEDQLQALQNRRLTRLLQHAIRNVPYYQQRVQKSGMLSVTDFPILTKSEIRENYQDLMTDTLRAEYLKKSKRKSLYTWVEVMTGGSTGVPTTVIHDKELRDRGRASRLYTQHLCGFPLGIPYFRLWGNIKDINNTNASFYHRIASRLSNETILNAYKMSDYTISSYIDRLNVSSIEHMMVYADAAYQVGKYILRTGRTVKPLKSIMSCASTLTPEMRQTLEVAFGTRVHNKYGSRDCTDMACECEQGGFHILTNQVLLEIVDAEGALLPLGETGRILVTTLFNDSFPIIRYEIGDMGALSERKCPCGRPFPLLDRLEGRSVEFLLSNDGEYVSPSIITSLIGITHNPGFVKRFQLIQHSLIEYEILVEMDPDISEAAYDGFVHKVQRDLKVVFGMASRIDMRQVPEIPVTASGKYIYTLNKVKELRKETSVN